MKLHRQAFNSHSYFQSKYNCEMTKVITKLDGTIEMFTSRMFSQYWNGTGQFGGIARCPFAMC